MSGEIVYMPTAWNLAGTETSPHAMSLSPAGAACHSAFQSILQPLSIPKNTYNVYRMTRKKKRINKLQKKGWIHTVIMCLCECSRHSKCTSLTSLVMGMAEGMRGLLPSSSRVRNSILFSSSQSAYEPMSRYLHQLHTLTSPVVEPTCTSSGTSAGPLHALCFACDAAACAA